MKAITRWLNQVSDLALLRLLGGISLACGTWMLTHPVATPGLTGDGGGEPGAVALVVGMACLLMSGRRSGVAS